MNSIETINSSALDDYDTCAIITDHSNVDYNEILKSNIGIVDTRNVFKNKNLKNINRLGMGKNK